MRETPLKESTLPNDIKWESIDWIYLTKYVEKLQQRIYYAESLGNHRKVRDTQRLLIRSRAALIISIKRVTQINKGKKTPGVDAFTVLNNTEREKLYIQMKSYNINSHNPKPTKRTYIRKKNGKLRPLSIPTIKDRIYQNVVKMALEPQWEQRFEATSYGFRPKRGCHDAVERIFKSCVRGKKKWIFEGDFKGCFDNLKHEHILEQINKFPQKEIINKWLTCGYIDNNTFNETKQGSGQGSIISPVIANIALHGMEEQLGIKHNIYYKKDGTQWVKSKSKYALSRYADDFVIICETKEDAEEIFNILTPYLEKRGLELEPSKTKITHIEKGFDFLGFNIRMYETINGNKLLIKPSKESIKNSKRKISEKVKELHGNNVGTLMVTLNPIIRGIANYWSPQVSSEVFGELDTHIFRVTYRFLNRLHPKKSKGWINKRYYKPDIKGKSKNRWILTDPINKKQLFRMKQVHIRRHKLIAYKSTPYNPKLKRYFEKRNIKGVTTNKDMLIAMT